MVAEGSDLRRRLGLNGENGVVAVGDVVAEGSDLRRRLGHDVCGGPWDPPPLWQREAISVGDLDSFLGS